MSKSGGVHCPAQANDANVTPVLNAPWIASTFGIALEHPGIVSIGQRGKTKGAPGAQMISFGRSASTWHQCPKKNHGRSVALLYRTPQPMIRYLWYPDLLLFFPLYTFCSLLTSYLCRGAVLMT